MGAILIHIIFHFSFWGYTGNTSINEVKKEPEALKQAIFTVWGDIYYIYEKGNLCFVKNPDTEKSKQLRDFISVVAIEATKEGNLLIVGLDYSRRIKVTFLDRYLEDSPTKDYQFRDSHPIEQLFGMTETGDGGFSVLFSRSGKYFIQKLKKQDDNNEIEEIKGKIGIKNIHLCSSDKRNTFILIGTDEKDLLRIEQIDLHNNSVRVIIGAIPVESGYDQYFVKDLSIDEKGMIYLVGNAQKNKGANDPWMCKIEGTKSNEIIYNKVSDERGNNQYQAIIESNRNKFEVLRSHYDGYSVQYSIKSVDSLGKTIPTPLYSLSGKIEGKEYGKAQMLCSKNGAMTVLSTDINGEIQTNDLKLDTSLAPASDIYIESMHYVSPKVLLRANKAESKEQGFIELSIVNPTKKWVHISPRLKCRSDKDPSGNQEFPFYATLKAPSSLIRIPIRACKENFNVSMLDIESKTPSIDVQIEKASTIKIEMEEGNEGRLDRIDNKLRITAEIHHQLALKYIGIRLPNGHSWDLFANRNIISSKLTEVDTVLVWSENYGLKEGENVLVLYAEDSLGASSEPIKINFSKKRGNLYVISIAPDYSNSKDYNPLMYNRVDALAIESLLLLQKGGNALFEDVKPFPHVTEESSRKAAIDGRIEYFIKKIGPQMDPNFDVTIFYFSGHGSVSSDGVFEFIPSRLDTDTVPLNMKSVLNEISRIPGKKLVIIDACRSGHLDNKGSDINRVNTKGNDSNIINSALDSLKNQANGTRVLTSSGKWQSSYESHNLKHSYFTFALIEALSNSYLSPSKKAGKPFLSDDALLILSEQDISAFISKRVPELLNNEGIKGFTQNPDNKIMEKGWPLFGIRIK